ncbi:hypothetical protein [Arthrobacter sp. C152]
MRPDRARTGERALSIAFAAAASLSAALLAAPAQATAAEGWSESESAPLAAPFSDEEIQSLLQSGDVLGANSRIAANRFASGNAYQTY